MTKLASSLLFSLIAAASIGCGASAVSDKATATEAQHLELFDDLDFNVFTNQKWEDVHKSHGADIVVHWPDGRITRGIDPHIDDLKAMFVWAPNTRVEVHPVKVAQADWTAVVGIMEGTFSEPMPIGEGNTIPPTGKSFKIRMATFGHWVNGTMDEEFLFWDNKEFMKQIGLGE